MIIYFFAMPIHHVIQGIYTGMILCKVRKYWFLQILGVSLKNAQRSGGEEGGELFVISFPDPYVSITSSLLQFLFIWVYICLFVLGVVIVFCVFF